MKTEDMIRVMEAYLDGKPIEARSHSEGSEWYDCEKPKWDWFNSEYRERKIKRGYWAIIDNLDDVVEVFHNPMVARMFADGRSDLSVVHLAEVDDE